MEKLYRATKIRRQSFHNWMDNQKQMTEMYLQLKPIVREIRTDHPGMSPKTIYELVNPDKIGRDKFIDWCYRNGFKLERKRNRIRTTNSIGVERFPNLIRNFNVTRANQVWVSDITYYKIKDKVFYITLIMDQYSKMIVGYSCSKSLKTIHTTIPALKMALKNYIYTGRLILHSDGGGQYYCAEFIAITSQAEIENSMTQENSENNHAERLNGTIKNQYLKYYMPTNFSELQRQLTRTVKNYNKYRPHMSLGKRIPTEVHGLSTKNHVIHKEKRSKKESIKNYY